MAEVLITGAAGGIGSALCAVYARRGARVIAVCRTASAALSAVGARIEAGLDLTRAADHAELARRLHGTHLDVLIHNAAVLSEETLEGFDADATQRVRAQFEINALVPLSLTAALLPNLASGAKIALITSRMGSIADNSSGGYYGYRMSKAALNAAGKSLAHDLRTRGIAVILLHPGFVRTAMTGGRGDIDADTAARNLVARIDELTLARSGEFRHANGAHLPW